MTPPRTPPGPALAPTLVVLALVLGGCASAGTPTTSAAPVTTAGAMVAASTVGAVAPSETASGSLAPVPDPSSPDPSSSVSPTPLATGTSLPAPSFEPLTAVPDPPATTGEWKLVDHPTPTTWRYEGPVAITLTQNTGDLAAELGQRRGVTNHGGIACAKTGNAPADCFVPIPGGYLDAMGLTDADTVRTFLLAWRAAVK